MTIAEELLIRIFFGGGAMIRWVPEVWKGPAVHVESLILISEEETKLLDELRYEVHKRNFQNANNPPQ